MPRFLSLVLLAFFSLLGCRTAAPAAAAVVADVRCGTGAVMKVHFYDVGQALAALVELPSGQLILVDAGENPRRAGCGAPCRAWNERFLAALRRDVAGRAIDLLWVTHPHSDHLGGVPSVVEAERVITYADNGLDREKATVKAAIDAAQQQGARVVVATTELPKSLLATSEGLSVRAVMPKSLHGCDNANNCSVGLRVDYCASSVLFVGDAEIEEEDELEPLAPVTVLQVGHHGSDTSSGDTFLAKVKPQWAVISAAPKDEGTNRTYCHPRASTVQHLSATLGDVSGATMLSFDGSKCRSAGPDAWREVPASVQLLLTARDGDVTLVTTGDGRFVRQ